MAWDSQELFEILRARMIAEQIRGRGITEARLLAALAAVPRERFVPAMFQAEAYEDRPLPIPAGQTISQPYIVARMISLLQLQPSDRVLEVGSGSGYAAAILSRLAHEVYGIERQEILVHYAQQRLAELGYDNVTIRAGDGTLGWPEHAPYDAILVSAGSPAVPDSLRQQLAMRGRLVIPVGPRPRLQILLRLTRQSENRFFTEEVDAVAFVPLIGEEGWQEESGSRGATRQVVA